MAKDRSEKKDKKEKRKSVDASGVKKEKKEKRKSDATAVLNAIEDAAPGAVAVDADGDVVVDIDESAAAVPLGALVPFANPLCDDKATKKVLKTVKKAAKQKCLKRGVKEVVKAVRKTTPADPATAQVAAPAIVVLAADISPMDVISHIPVLCEDHNIPYVFLPSRAELGAAGSTKRPTSVVMVTPTAGKKGEEKDDEWDEAYKELNKLVVKQGQHVKV
ncbi:L30e-like protein [Aureobasidium sp. EXF-10727]|nr:L30e-like protein [Aureobasidium sp. EXF-10727]